MRKWLLVGLACLGIVLAIFLVDGHTPEKTQAQGNVATFTGVNLDCKSCEAKIVNALNKIIGIEKYELHPKKHSITVTFNHEYMHAEWIKNSLEADGFDIKKIIK